MKQIQTKYQYAICVENKSSEDLVLGKVYQVLPDEEAAKEGYLRVMDESGEDYLYPGEYFVAITLPKAAERALFSASTSSSFPAA